MQLKYEDSSKLTDLRMIMKEDHSSAMKYKFPINMDI